MLSAAARGAPSIVGLLMLTAAACADADAKAGANAGAHVAARASGSPAADSAPVICPLVAPTAPAPPGDSSGRADSSGTGARGGPADSSGDAVPRPVLPMPLPGSILPGCRIVAYYGNPLSRRMGILGQIPPDQMLARLREQAAAYAAADTLVPVRPALELIATVAQASPGPGGLYRLRMRDTLIDRMAALAEREGMLLILDVQVGKSTVAAELEPLRKYLARSYVHLALDPEFSMKRNRPPGTVVGTMDAADVNVAVKMLAELVTDSLLPPKVLIVHRFTKPMLTNHERITIDPRVQVVIDMDGFGPPWMKYASYKAYVHDRPVQFAGFKLFYKNDKPLLSPKEVLALDPVPQYVMYQ